MTGNAAYVHCPVLLALAGAHGHEPIHSAFEVSFNQSGRIAWRGANANGYQVRSMVGEVDVMITSTILYFIWNSGYIEAEAQSGGKVISNQNRPTFGYVLPPGTRVGFRVKEAGENRQLSVELERDFLVSAAGFEPPVSLDVVETWDYRDPLSWQLARVIYDECISRAPQGTLYTETAATLLAMHLVRNLIDYHPPQGDPSRRASALAPPSCV
jgi:AraC family transcriptional regulator